MGKRVKSQWVVELLVISAIKSVLGHLAVLICKPAIDWIVIRFRNLLKSKDKNQAPENYSEKNSGL
jgi:hypothetical protein